MAKLLSSLGITCGHEAIFTFDGLERAKDRLAGRSKIFLSPCCVIDPKTRQKLDTSWFDASKLVADASYMAAPFLDDEIFKETKIIHLVRDPLKVISSQLIDAQFFSYPNSNQILWQKFVLKFLPELFNIKTQVERACYFYKHWNEMIANSKNCLVHKIENGLTKELCDFLKINFQTEANISIKTNSWHKRKRNLTLSDIPDGIIKKEFIELGTKLQYCLS